MMKLPQIVVLPFISIASIGLFSTTAVDAEVNLNRLRMQVVVNENEAEDIRFESEDGTTIVELTRRQLGEARRAGKFYRAERLMVEHKGYIDSITTLSNLEYQNTHHNFADTLKAFTESYRYELEIRYVWHDNAGVWRGTISKFDIASEDIVWGPVPITVK